MINETKNTSSLSFLERMVKGKEKSVENINHFFSSVFEKMFEKKELNTIGHITKRNTYDTILPNEIFLKIFDFLPFDTRLSILPQVCYQFYLLSNDFSLRCYDLHHLIPKVQTFVQKELAQKDSRLYALDFKNKETISFYEVLFEKKNVHSQLFQTIIKCNPELVNSDDFDFLNFSEKLIDSNPPHYNILAKITHYELTDIIKIIGSTPIHADEIFDIKIMNECYKTNEETLKKIAQIWFNYNKLLPSKKMFDPSVLYKEVLLQLNEEERKPFETLITFIEAIDVPFDDWIKHMFNLKEKQPLINKLLSAPNPELLLEHIKEFIKEQLDNTIFKADNKHSFFLVNKEDVQFTNYVELFSLNSSLGDEHRWLAERIIKPISNGKK